MKELPKTPGRRALCPEDCRYRARDVPFCGFCLAKIKRELGTNTVEEERDGSGEERSRQGQDKDA